MCGFCDCQYKMWWVRFREFGELLYGWRFPLILNVAVCKSFVGPAMLYESEA